MKRDLTIDGLGDGVETATFATWLVEEGEVIQKGQAVAEVMTDKVNLEIESPWSGTVATLNCEPDDEIRPGQVIASIVEAEA